MRTSGASGDLRLKRIFLLHQTLRQSRRGWSAEALCDICREIDPAVNRRTVMNDLKFMREVLHAPLPERANKHHGYAYTSSYSLLEGLDDSYLGGLNEALALLRQLARAKEFIGLEDLLLRLEQRVSLTSAEANSVIQFEEVEQTGRQHLIGLYQAIQQKQFLSVQYRPFSSEKAYARLVFPLLLKEYNHRWVLVGWEETRTTPQNLPLDRIVSFRPTAVSFPYPTAFDSRSYFTHVIGTTRIGEEPQQVVLRFSAERGRYVETKKIHSSQQSVWLADGRLEVGVWVELNRELEARLLEFGSDVEVLQPPPLRQRIAEQLRNALQLYGL